MEYRIEHDSMGEVKVPADKYWAAQTERSHENFKIGVGIETMPREITHAFGVLKKAAAIANHKLKSEKMTDEKLAAISQACDEVMSGALNEHFPLVVWQTGHVFHIVTKHGKRYGNVCFAAAKQTFPCTALYYSFLVGTGHSEHYFSKRNNLLFHIDS